MTAGKAAADLPVYDLLGVGFGPSNLSLAIAVEDHNAATCPTERLRARFFEKQPAFGWHRGMLIEGTTIQVSFLKDLVTMRNPQSDFSFVSFLKARQRLVDFINHKTLFPLRTEFHAYLEWAAHRLSHLVTYGTEVVSVRPVERGGPVDCFDLVVRETCGGERLTTYRARNIVLAVGLEMHLPEGARVGDRVFHNVELVHRVNRMKGSSPRRLVVVGAGQSAAETVDYLNRSFPEAEVCSVFTRYGYTPADDSPFANRIFDPEAVDHFFESPAAVKQMLFDYHRNTNYSVVDTDLIEDLYRRVYQQKLKGGAQPIRLLNASRVIAVQEGGSGVSATVEFLPTGCLSVLEADALVYATGYRPRDVAGMVGICCTDECGRPEVTRDYRAVTEVECTGGIYLQGGTEHAHGITSSLLSTVAVRAGEVLGSMLARAGQDNRTLALSAPPR